MATMAPMDPHLHQRASQPHPPPPALCMRTMQMMLPRWEKELYPFYDLMNIKAYLPHTHILTHTDTARYYFMHCGKVQCIKRNESLLTFQQVVLPCFLKHRFAKTLICLKSVLHSPNTAHFLQNSTSILILWKVWPFMCSAKIFLFCFLTQKTQFSLKKVKKHTPSQLQATRIYIKSHSHGKPKHFMRF